ncbi:L,D-transpeptidase family protein [Polyangium fumosum]|uniref:L,D-transpeptidase family protein n=1 Tax=Polyangium fumosum TaxID=889272 RepID=UPI003B830D67
MPTLPPTRPPLHPTSPSLNVVRGGECTDRRWDQCSGLGQVWGPTDGCIGLANEDVDVLYAIVPVGTKVTIKP